MFLAAVCKNGNRKKKSLVGNEREAVSETLGIENGGLGGMD